MKRDLCGKYGYEIGGRSPQGERGLKQGAVPRLNDARGRSPQGERGLKPDQVWPDSVQWNSRSPQGERGLKPGLDRQPIGDAVRRSPQGERGLKLCYLGL